MTVNRIFLLVFASAALAADASAAEFHVATDGDDAADGTKQNPFATVARAREAVRGLTKDGLAADVRVVVRGGTYRLRTPLSFGPEDAGTEKHSVTYAAARGEQPVFCGGTPITGWEQEEAGVWTVVLPEVKAGRWTFRNLYVNGRRATRARSPNSGFFHVVRGGPDNRTSFVFRKGDVKAYEHPGDAEIVFLHDWATSRIPFKSVDIEKQTATLIDGIGTKHRSFGFTGFEPHPRYFVEGAAELLDAPGEWHLDTRTGQLTYLAREGQTPENTQVVAPRIERLLEVQGAEDKPVRNLHLDGLVFAHTNWPLPEFGASCMQAAFHEPRPERGQRKGLRPIPPAAHIEFAEDCSIRRCRFLHLGGSGIALRKGSHRNRVEGCEVADVAANGINVGESYWARRIVQDGKPTWQPIPHVVTRKNLVANCLVRECGRQFFGSIGVWVGITDGTVIRHCEIRNLPYTGVSVGWRWDTTPTASANNLVESCHIHHVMQYLSDGGGIYTLGRQPGTVLRGNHIHDIPANAGRSESNGMFLDQGTSLIVIEKNVLHSIAKSILRFHRAEKNTVRDNVFFLSPGQTPYRFNRCSPSTMSFDDKHVPATLSTVADGRVGRALKCDGIRAHVDAPHARSLDPEQLTLEAWIRLRRYPGGKDWRRWIAGKNTNEWVDGHYAIGIAGKTAVAYLNIGGERENSRETSVGTKPLKLNTWHHLAMTYDGKQLIAYLDGTPSKPTIIAKTRRPGRGSFSIGRRPDGHVYFEGLVDEVRMYQRALTADEIRQNVAKPGTATDKGLVKHWGFELQVDEPGDLGLVKQAGIQPPFREFLLGANESQ
jgi:hypothetical protein